MCHQPESGPPPRLPHACLEAMSSPEPASKTIKLVLSSQYNGVQNYTAVRPITDPVSILKSVPLSSTGPYVRRDDLTLLFRGQKVSREDEEGTFEALMRKVRSCPCLFTAGMGSLTGVASCWHGRRSPCFPWRHYRRAF